MRILSLVLALGLASCSSGAFCERQSKCSNEPKRDVMACQESLKKYGNCQKQQEAWENCKWDHEVCSMDKRHDEAATVGYAVSQCKSQKKDLDACFATDGGAN